MTNVRQSQSRASHVPSGRPPPLTRRIGRAASAPPTCSALRRRTAADTPRAVPRRVRAGR